MSVQWSAVEPKLIRVLNSIAIADSDAEMRKDGFNAALDAFSVHTAKLAKTEFTGDGSTVAWSLPADFLSTPDSIKGIRVSSGQNLSEQDNWLEEQIWVPGESYPQWTDTSGIPSLYFIWPSDKINILPTLASGSKVEMYYYAAWAEVTAPTSVIDAPRWSHRLLMYYAAAYCIAPSGIKSAKIRQFAQRQDSGSPEDNPIHDQAQFYLKLYERELVKYQPQRDGVVFKPGRG